MLNHGQHFNKDVYILENKVLRVAVLKDYGAKIASIYHKKKRFEFLFQPSKGEYTNPVEGDFFAKYDTSGLDDAIPTIDVCCYPKTELMLCDHGDVWSKKWIYEEKADCLMAEVFLNELPLCFSRTMSLEESKLTLSYTLKNLSQEKIYYLWALHGLNVFDEDTKFIFPDAMTDIINVMEEKDYCFDWKKLKNFPDNGAYKFYFQNTKTVGDIGILYEKQRLNYLIRYDEKILPYLGVWITKGGFKGEYNCAIEPCTGYYDSLERCFSNHKVSFIEGNMIKKWNVEIEIQEL